MKVSPLQPLWLVLPLLLAMEMAPMPTQEFLDELVIQAYPADIACRRQLRPAWDAQHEGRYDSIAETTVLVDSDYPYCLSGIKVDGVLDK